MTTHEETVQTDAGDVKAEAHQVAAEKENVRERIRRLVVDSVRQRRVGFDAIGDVTREIVDGAVEGVRDMTPDDRDSVLRQVVDGVGDAFTTTAQATRLALEEAQSRGEQFAKEDVRSAIRQLTDLQRLFTDTVLDTLERARIEAAEQTRDFIDHARRANERVQPSIQSALHAATEHPIKLVTETASASVRAVPKAAGMLLHAMSGVLQGAGDLLTEGRQKEK